ncbi:MAG: hypothetical protein GY750_19940 [Lentisphaerae bacterium]|nr:hypothetical protein [Bacteroidota bacterium]MCP4103667.1 hypothetical protein [Lentisphaerota bacterium]
MTILKEEPSSLTKSYKFVRRPDLSPALRMKIAALVLVFSYHGQVTRLSEKYSVSRSFIYGLKAVLSIQLEGIFDTANELALSRERKRQKAQEKILNLRLIGKCSLSAISELLLLENLALPHSVCFISQFLSSLGAKLGKMVDWKGAVHYASDEIFMIGHEPVLVTVDPISSAILQMERLKVLSKEAWMQHWQRLGEANIIPLSLVKDEGAAMRAAQQEGQSDVAVQTDTFHGVSHRLGIFTSRLEKAVNKAITYEWERQEVAQKAKNEKVKIKKEAAYKQACQQTFEAIEQYENFQFLYSCLVEQFNVFDHQGKARRQEFAIQEAQCALDMMKQLAIPKLNDQIKAIEKLLPQLFDFLPKAQLIQFELETELGQSPAYFWIYTWQNDKKSRKTKNTGKSRVLRQKATIALLILQEHYLLKPTEFDSFKKRIFERLDSIIQSSALVETINSLLRPYMNGARNQLSQEQFNIIRFYLNHRIYKRGKRKGFAPIELLKAKKLNKTWLLSLLEYAA